MRQRIDWFQIMSNLDNPELNEHFFKLFGSLRKGKSMSCNRCAYYVLKSYYSTTTIDQLADKLGV